MCIENESIPSQTPFLTESKYENDKRNPLNNGERKFSVFSKIPLGSKDPIFGIHESFLEDPDTKKIDLSIGIYKNGEGTSFIFPSVKKAQEKVIHSPSLDYLPIEGNRLFLEGVSMITFGEHFEPLVNKRIALIQSISGTGALRLAFDFLMTLDHLKDKAVYLTCPTYSNHLPIIRKSGFTDIRHFAYYDVNTNSLDFYGLCRDLKSAPDSCIVVFHAAAHNPTGTDPSKDQWIALSKICKEKQFVVIFDNAYQGFASGDVDLDAFGFRTFIEGGNDVLVCSSFSKNFGVYGLRTGYLAVVTQSIEEKKCVESQLKIIVRASYANPPLHGARILDAIIRDENLKQQWKNELRAVSERIKEMRKCLKDLLLEKDPEADWNHLTTQIGMFCYTGLSTKQMEYLKNVWHVYGTSTGRINVAALNHGNLEYVSEAIHDASKQ